MNMTTKFAAPSAGAVVVSEKESRLSYDRAMISCIKEDGGTHTFFKSRPPVRGFTLFFKDPQVMPVMGWFGMIEFTSFLTYVPPRFRNRSTLTILDYFIR